MPMYLNCLISGLIFIIAVLTAFFSLFLVKLRNESECRKTNEDSVSPEDIRGNGNNLFCSEFKKFFFCEFSENLNFSNIAVMLVSGLAVAVTSFFVLSFKLDAVAEIQLILASFFLETGAVIDFKIKKIPNYIPITFFLVRVIFIVIEAVFYKLALKSVLLSLVSSLVCLIVLFLLSVLTKGGLGMGDVKLITALAFCIGIQTTLATLFFSMLFTLFTAIFLLLFKKKSAKDAIPFGPFILFGYIIGVFF